MDEIFNIVALVIAWHRDGSRTSFTYEQYDYYTVPIYGRTLWFC